MSVPRYKAREQSGLIYEVLDLAADGQVILFGIPSMVVIDVVEALNAAYGTGVADGGASERIGRAGRHYPAGPDRLLSPGEMAHLLNALARIGIGRDAVEDLAEPTADMRMPGEFTVTAPATGQCFRVTVTLIGEDQ